MQEALTNVHTHTPGACTCTWVRIDHVADAVRLEVRNDAPRVPARRTDGSRRKIIGMRERDALHGGDLQAAPCGGGRRSLVRP